MWYIIDYKDISLHNVYRNRCLSYSKLISILWFDKKINKFLSNKIDKTLTKLIINFWGNNQNRYTKIWNRDFHRSNRYCVFGEHGTEKIVPSSSPRTVLKFKLKIPNHKIILWKTKSQARRAEQFSSNFVVGPVSPFHVPPPPLPSLWTMLLEGDPARK